MFYLNSFLEEDKKPGGRAWCSKGSHRKCVKYADFNLHKT